MIIIRLVNEEFESKRPWMSSESVVGTALNPALRQSAIRFPSDHLHLHCGVPAHGPVWNWADTADRAMAAPSRSSRTSLILGSFQI